MILPSLASADQMRLGEEMARVKPAGRLHFDVEDGNFVPNITFGLKTLRAARERSGAVFDAHLMTTNPLDYVDALGELRFAAVAFHWEATGYPMRLLNKIRDHGMRAGIALNPATPADAIAGLIGAADYVLVMTAEPDFRGDLFQSAMLGKIRRLRELRGDLEIIADGGLGRRELDEVRRAGAAGAVLGRLLFRAEDPERTLRELMEEA